MYRPIFSILLFSVILTQTPALAEWDWQKANPQKFKVTDRFATAVGEEIRPDATISYFPHELIRLLDGGDQSEGLEDIFDKKDIRLPNRVAVVPQRKGEQWLITDRVDNRAYLLVYTNRRGDLGRIFRLEPVRMISLQKAMAQGKEVRLKLTIIGEPAPVLRRTTLRNKVYVIDSIFSARPSLGNITFSAGADFSGSHFSNGLRFKDVAFNGPATFNDASAARRIDFSGTRFGSVSFRRTLFIGEAQFRESIFGGPSDFSQAQFQNEARFERSRFVRDAVFEGAHFEGSVRFNEVLFESRANFEKSKFTTIADFSRVYFKNNALFARAQFGNQDTLGKEGSGTKASQGKSLPAGLAIFQRSKFAGQASFRKAIFMRANFRGVAFAEADFHGAHFRHKANFSETRFRGPANFSAGKFEGPVNFTVASFSSDARFPFTFFAEPDLDVSFRGAWFTGNADFSYAGLPNVNYSSFSYTPDAEGLLEFCFEAGFESLDEGVLPDQVRKRLTDDYGLSPKTRVLNVDPGQRWLIEDSANQRVYDVIKEQGPLKSQKKKCSSENKLVLYLQSQGTHIARFNLIGANYERMKVDSQSIGRFIFDRPAFERFIKQQRDLGRVPEEYQNAVLAFKRYERSQKWILTRWMEAALFDWTTRYGTAKIPWGLFIYAFSSILFFTMLYAIRPDCLMFVRSDGSVDEERGPPGMLELFWFSVNTFTPAIEFFNAGNWRPRYTAMFPGGFVRFATIATFERIFGWAMVPALLSYF